MHRIYKLTFPDGKVYIGHTQLTLHARWNRGRGYKGTGAGEAIERYGWDNVQRELLAETEDPEEAARLEVKLIREYDATDPAKGYNICPGGRVKGWKSENREKCSARAAGKKNHFYGRHHSAETKRRIRESRIEAGCEPVNKQKVLCVETGVIYESTADATRQTGIHNFALRRVCYGQRKTAGGYHWQYV